MILRTISAFAIIAGLATVPAMASRVHRAPTSGHSHTRHHSHPVSHKMHGQQAIAPERVSAIQEALIHQHYLSGEPSSKWDSDTQAAMLKYQADQGWQTKITPDSRALIKLGLGPTNAGAINAGSNTNFNILPAPAAQPTPGAEGFIAASGVSH